MYIEFRLPMGAGGAAAGTALTQINIDIDNWVKKNNIQNFRCKLHKYTYRLSLSSDQDYSYFALTWTPKYSASRNFNFKQPK